MRVEEFFRLINWVPSTFEVKIYSLRAHSWRRVDDECPYKESYISKSKENLIPASLNGALHWLVTPLTEGAHLSPTIVAFDLANEKFRVYPQPVPSDRNVNMALEVLGGRILLSCVCENALVGFNDVWVMKEYGWQAPGLGFILLWVKCLGILITTSLW